MAIKKEIREQVYRKYDGHCSYCGKKIAYKEMQIDHYVPKYQNGEDSIKNYMPSCRRCNHYKRTCGIEVFRQNISEIPRKLLRDSYIYNVASDYGLVPTEKQNIIFYFEKFEEEKI